jgi:hypothetical protein
LHHVVAKQRKSEEEEEEEWFVGTAVLFFHCNALRDNFFGTWLWAE